MEILGLTPQVHLVPSSFSSRPMVNIPLIKSYKQTLYCHNSWPWLSCWLIPIHTYCLITIMCSCGVDSSWGFSGGKEHGWAPGEVHNKWCRLLLIGTDFNPMLHHCTWWVESWGFGLSVTSLCLQADTIISLIVTSLKQWHQEVIHQSISCDTRRKMTRAPLTYAENLPLTFSMTLFTCSRERVLFRTLNLSGFAIFLQGLLIYLFWLGPNRCLCYWSNSLSENFFSCLLFICMSCEVIILWS